jgi:hypothetical protein
MRQAGLFGLSDQLKRLSDCGDPLETMSRVVDFEVFRAALEKALAYGDGTKGGRPPYDPVAMFKVLILAAQNTVSDARMEFLIRDRLSWLRFLGFDLGAVTPDENTIRLFREKLTRAGAIDALFVAFDVTVRLLPGGLRFDGLDDVGVVDEILEELIPLVGRSPSSGDHVAQLVDTIVGKSGATVVRGETDADD